MSIFGLRPGHLEHFLGDLLDDARARIVVLIHAVAEAHQLALAVLHLLDEARDILVGADLVQHAEHFLVGAAVKRAGERGDRGGGGDERVGVRTAHRAHRAGAAILFVIGVQDEEHLERARQHRVGGVLGLGALPQHVHVVLGVAQFRIGVDVGQAQAVAVGVGGQGRHLADQADDLFAAGTSGS